MNITNCGPIVVTGAFGFVGRTLLQDLLKHNVPANSIHVIGRKVQSRPRIDKVNYHEGDLVDFDTINKVLVAIKPVLVFHTASPPHAGFSAEYYVRANVDATRNLIETLQTLGTKVFVYTSSTTVVDDDKTELHLITEEASPVLLADQRTEVYSVSKALAENVVMDANGRGPSHMLTVSLRPAAIFGTNDGVCVSSMVTNAQGGRHKYQIGDGTNLFDFVYVDNVARAHLQAADVLLREWSSWPASASSPTTKVNGEAFFVTNDEPWLFWHFARTVASLAGFPLEQNEITVIPKAASIVFAYIVMWITWIVSFGQKESQLNPKSVRYSCRNWTFSVDKAKKRFGYRPAVSVEEGLKISVPLTVESLMGTKDKERKKDT